MRPDTIASVKERRRELDLPDYLDRFAWHPEPELIGFREEAASRPAVRRLGEATWEIALGYLYEHAMQRAMGAASSYDTARAAFFGERGGPGGPPIRPARADDVLEEFRARLAGSQLLSLIHI